jgi:hypothetical protein
MKSRRWLLLLHQIPPKPGYLRARILRRLSELGALAIKNSAYLLPDTKDTSIHFARLCREIEQEGGAAWLFRSQMLSGISDEQIEDAFRQLHALEYENLTQQSRKLLEECSPPSKDALSAYRRLSKRSQKLRTIDFFDSPLRPTFEQILSEVRQGLRSAESHGVSPIAATRGRVWVTRKGIHVDQIASAWLIRRFIDPLARFRFVEIANYPHSAEEIRFGMIEGEFTRRGNSCTFEMLLSTNDLRTDLSLVAISEIIHDIELQDDRFQRKETPGLSKLIKGLCSKVSPDERRLEQGALIFESLYESFG